MKNTIFKLLLFLFTLNSSAQNRFNTTIGIESYSIEYLLNKFLYNNYAGQSFTFQNYYNLNKRTAIGIGTGLFFHHRNGYSKGSNYSYLPFQFVYKFHTITNKFQLSLSLGIPMFLNATDDYVGSQGFWYKDIESNPNQGFDGPIYLSQSKIKTGITLVNNLRFHFKIQKRYFFSIGIQHFYYNYYYYNAGFNPKPNQISKEHFLNLSLGLEYHFNWKTKQKKIAE